MTVEPEKEAAYGGAAGPRSIEEVAWRMLAALERNRDALNGDNHPGEPHDRYLHFDPCTNLPGVAHAYDLTGDCSMCGGAQYGSEDLVNAAWGDLRTALGLERYGWQPEYDEAAFTPLVAALQGADSTEAGPPDVLEGGADRDKQSEEER